MKIADIINIAIDRHLWQGDANDRSYLRYEFSCAALGKASKYSYRDRVKVGQFILPMGIDLHGIAEQFKEIPAGPKRQYARALWLTWAAMIAREEGV